MSDLISRKAVLDEIHKYFRERIDHGIYEADVVDCSAHLSKRIGKIPVAFDMDKVVEQIERLKPGNKDFTSHTITNFINTCINIVKGGGQAISWEE